MAIITVTNTYDKNEGSLRDAIAKAKGGDTIKFASSLANKTITLTSGQLSIEKTKNITIDGTGAANLIISGNKTSRVFSVSREGQFTLKNLTIANGKTNEQGGAIKADALSKVNIYNVTFDKNESKQGGALFGGDYSKINVENSKFTNNNAGSVVNNNIGLGKGGAIHIGTKSTLVVINSQFNNNIAGRGGAIQIDPDSKATVIDSNFDKNNGTVANDGFSAGAIASAPRGSLLVQGSRFTNNSGETGGAIYKSLGSLTVENSYFFNNIGEQGGGGIYTDGANGAGPNGTSSTVGGTTRISGSWFEKNQGIGPGGGVYLYQYYPDKGIVENSTFIENKAIANGKRQAFGGGIAGNGDLTIRNITFSKNISELQGGALWVDGTVNSKYSVINIDNSTFSGNKATGSNGAGGAITINPSGYVKLNLRNSTVVNNYASLYGGAYWIVGGSKQLTTLTNTITLNNTANDLTKYGQQAVHQLRDGGGNIEFPSPQHDWDSKVTANSLVANPKLGSLKNVGGVWVHPLLSGSPAIDAGVANAPTIDQGGFFRGNKPDIGAVEFNSAGTLKEIAGTSRNDVLVGGSANNRIIGSLGADKLTGGGGNDHFYYTNILDRGDTITDFETGKDKIVLTQLLNNLFVNDYTGTNAIADGLVKVVQGNSPSNFRVQIDSDGTTGINSFRNLITVNVTGSDTLNSSGNFVF